MADFPKLTPWRDKLTLLPFDLEAARRDPSRVRSANPLSPPPQEVRFAGDWVIIKWFDTSSPLVYDHSNLRLAPAKGGVITANGVRLGEYSDLSLDIPLEYVCAHEEWRVYATGRRRECLRCHKVETTALDQQRTLAAQRVILYALPSLHEATLLAWRQLMETCSPERQERERSARAFDLALRASGGRARKFGERE